jgi:urease accessory protein UreF
MDRLDPCRTLATKAGRNAAPRGSAAVRSVHRHLGQAEGQRILAAFESAVGSAVASALTRDQA